MTEMKADFHSHPYLLLDINHLQYISWYLTVVLYSGFTIGQPHFCRVLTWIISRYIPARFMVHWRWHIVPGETSIRCCITGTNPSLGVIVCEGPRQEECD